ncbi:unnamed protein product [Strongylus vulgaris]|uniref:Glycosyltransferase family 92 protein n=1 Tax=Strongylus vulgaris TaxID=40348 RepID=A0A3P7IL29_STRVU|nr:unnamed protein product [Strongylus vulgaris]
MRFVLCMSILLLHLHSNKSVGEEEALPKDRNFNKQRGYHIKDCVPHYEQLEQHKQARTSERKVKATTLSLIASYDYGNYIVVTTEADGWFGRTMYCRYFDTEHQELLPATESFVFPEFAVHCCSRKNAHFMSVSGSPFDNILEYVPLLDRRKDEPRYNLSLCLAPMYGDERKWLLLVELIEHYKIQGVEHFYLYVKDMDDYTLKLIKHYVESGVAEVIFFRKDNDRPGLEWQLVETEADARGACGEAAVGAYESRPLATSS